MRQNLQIKDSSLPRYGEKPGARELARVEKQMAEWLASDFAGFRRILEKGSDAYPNFSAIKKLAEERKTGSSGKPISDFVLFGTGGSSLGAEAILKCLHPIGRKPRFHILDNNDPDWLENHLRDLQPESTLFFVVSKSGKTPETIAQFLRAMEWSQKKLSGDWKKHFILCTDPEKGDLREVAKRFELACLDVPASVGGRFSVLTAVGLFPAAFAGLNIETFHSGARSIAEWEKQPLAENPCFQMARSFSLSFKERPVTIFMPYNSQLSAFSRWFCQLWAESLGKNGKGPTPYPAMGTTDQHSQMQLYMQGPANKCLVFVRVLKSQNEVALNVPAELEDLPSFRELRNRSMLDLFDAEFCATRDAFTKNEIPNITLELECLDEFTLGALFYFWQFTTALTGAVMEINPFDQPGVEAAKILTKRYLLERRK
jgi:glucose-6-phosphate isomerase